MNLTQCCIIILCISKCPCHTYIADLAEQAMGWFPLCLGLVVDSKPTELSYDIIVIYTVYITITHRM